MAKQARTSKPHSRAAEAVRFAAPRRRRAKQQREGIVILIVMLMVVMATGSALFAIQSTQYEQRAATAVAEANWARGVAECATMAGLAYVEDPGAPKPTGRPEDVDVAWIPQGADRARYSRKYGLPAVITAQTASGTQTPDNPLTVSLATPPYIASAPRGLDQFLPHPRRRNTDYPLFADYDDPTNATQGLHFTNAHWLQESLTVRPETTSSTKTQTTRTRTVVTGFGEIQVIGDPLDSDNARGLHELDAISRGYIDKVQ